VKHVILSDGWSFSNEPSPAYYLSKVLDKYKPPNVLIPVQGVHPITIYNVKADSMGKNIYKGTDRAIANALKDSYDEEQLHRGRTAKVQASVPILPENQFTVIKSGENNISIIPGEDYSKQCLMFIGYSSNGCRSGVSLLEEGTTAEILMTCFMGDEYKYGSRIEVVALMDVGQRIAFYKYSRFLQQVYYVTWAGDAYFWSMYNKRDWDERDAVTEIPKSFKEL
jgi:hypothetical protein